MIKFSILNLVRVSRCDFMSKDRFNISSDLPSSEKDILSPNAPLGNAQNSKSKSFGNMIKNHLFELLHINKGISQKNSNNREK